MASAKSGALIFVGSLVVLLIILLNFDILPKRRLSEELEFSTKAEYKESLIPSAGYLSVPTSQAITSKVSAPEGIKILWFVVNMPRFFSSSNSYI